MEPSCGDTAALVVLLEAPLADMLAVLLATL